MGFNFSGAPFVPVLVQNLTFLSCPSELLMSRFTAIACLSDSIESVLATASMSLAESMSAASCRIISTLPVPVSKPDQAQPEQFSFDLRGDFLLAWRQPDCEACELHGGICGYKNNTSQEIRCFFSHTGARMMGDKTSWTSPVDRNLSMLGCQNCGQSLCFAGVDTYAGKFMNDPSGRSGIQLSAARGANSMLGFPRMDNSFVVLPNQRPQSQGLPRPREGAVQADSGQTGKAMEESFVVLYKNESPSDGGGMHMQSPDGALAGAMQPNNSGFHSTITVLKRAFEIAKTQTQVEQPLCLECMRILSDKLEKEVEDVDRGIKAYEACLQRLEGETRNVLCEADFLKEQLKIEEEERRLEAAIKETENQYAEVHAELKESQLKSICFKELEERIENDKVGNYSITQSFKKQEYCTKALKCTLCNLKWALYWFVGSTNFQPLSAPMEATATAVPKSKSFEIFNLFVRLLDGKTLTLKFTSPFVAGHALKHRLFESTGIPPNHQRLITGLRQIEDDSIISCFGESSRMFPTVYLLLRLLGGKGGFGSLLRGAATKVGQKKTNNFSACRDMSGRRLRHVNVEKQLKEWKAEEEERRLEKVAEEFLKKKANVGKNGVGDSAAQKYVEKYREESARCVAEVEESVRDVVMKGGNGKRKGGLTVNGTDAKKLKIWMGKSKLGESDSDDSEVNDTDNEEENERSVILNSGCQSDSNKDIERSSDFVICGEHGGVSGGASSDSGSEEGKDLVVQESMEFVGCSGEKVPYLEQIGVVEMNDQIITQGTVVPCTEIGVVSAAQVSEAVKQDGSEIKIAKSDVAVNPQDMLGLNNGEVIEDVCGLSKPNASPGSNLSGNEETIASTCNSEMEVPLNFDDFCSAVEIEILGLERLKSELQARGLKCGGTLQERAARLFLLKSSPLDKLPKKLLAKK